jgi:DNA polymerase-1
VEEAARTGETGGLVRSWLGRTCPPPSVTLREIDGGYGDDGGEPPRTDAASRARGRFTRNFVIQATAAEWAIALLARLRATLAPPFPRSWKISPEIAGETIQDRGEGAPELVFFQHDEVVVHCRKEQADAIATAVEAAAADARRLLFGDTDVRFPLGVSTVECYADAK